jgi:hypothetical protein
MNKKRIHHIAHHRAKEKKVDYSAIHPQNMKSIRISMNDDITELIQTRQYALLEAYLRRTTKELIKKEC